MSTLSNFTGTHNGYIEDFKLYHAGNTTWDDLDDSPINNWDGWTSWTNRSNTEPLRYQTNIIDLGSSKYVWPHVKMGITGTGRVVVEYGEASNLSDATTVGAYTNDNTTTGTIQLYSLLDFIQAGYTDDDYAGFKARYVRFTVFAENYIRKQLDVDSATVTYAPGQPVIGYLSIELKDEMLVEYQNDIAVSGETHTLVPRDVGTITDILITAHSEADKKLIGQIVNKTNKTIRIVDANKFDTAAQTATVDLAIVGFPSIAATVDGGINRVSESNLVFKHT
jgi:hypothetical protein